MDGRALPELRLRDDSVKEGRVKVRLFAMCWLAFCAAVFAQGGTGTIAGKLTDQNGAPAISR